MNSASLAFGGLRLAVTRERELKGAVDLRVPIRNAAVAPSKSRRILDLVEPVEAHFLDHAVGDHDQPRLRSRMVVEMLVDGERRHVDEIAALPGKFLRLRSPLPVESVEAVELQGPMQVV